MGKSTIALSEIKNAGLVDCDEIYIFGLNIYMIILLYGGTDNMMNV